jgi:hypothetical protein
MNMPPGETILYTIGHSDHPLARQSLCDPR